MNVCINNQETYDELRDSLMSLKYLQHATFGSCRNDSCWTGPPCARTKLSRHRAINFPNLPGYGRRLWGCLCSDNHENEDDGRVAVQWSKLQIIAVSARIWHFNASKLQDLILQSQRVGCRIRKLLLLQNVISEEDIDVLVELKKLVEIDEFHVGCSIGPKILIGRTVWLVQRLNWLVRVHSMHSFLSRHWWITPISETQGELVMCGCLDVNGGCYRDRVGQMPMNVGTVCQMCVDNWYCFCWGLWSLQRIGYSVVGN